jgi:hypothetical protein
MKKALTALVLGLGVCGGVLMLSTVHAQQTTKDRVKVTAAEYEQRGKEGAVIAGYNTQNGCTWMNVFYPGGNTVKQYWDCGSGTFGSTMGTYQVVGDMICPTWDDGRGFCSEAYRIGEEKFELWIRRKSEDPFTPVGTYYRLK